MLKLLAFLKPYLGLVLLVVVFLFGQALAELFLPTLMSDVVNNGMVRGDSAYIWRYGTYMAGAALVSTVCSIVSAYLASMVAVGLGRDVRARVFSRVEAYSLREFDRFGTASLITRTTNDVTQVQTLLVMAMRFMVYAPIMCAGGLMLAYGKNHALTWVLALVLPVMLAVIATLATLIVPLFRTMQSKLDTVNRVLRENLVGIRVIRAFDRQDAESERFRLANRELTDISIRVNQIMAAIQPVMMLMLNVTSIAIIWLGGKYIAQNFLTLGDMMAFIQYAMQIMFSIIMVTLMFVMMPRAQASAVRINEVLELVPGIVDPAVSRSPAGVKGRVELRNVTFRYPGAEEPAIRNVSFTTFPGELTAIIGGTGSGKSTLISLIPRFYDVESGSVTVDGVDVREMSQPELRARIGFVPQTPVLFSGTIASNIRYGKQDATDDEVAHAGQVAQAEEFVGQLGQGYDSPVAQGGTNLSGGQKQRLSIARALVRRPEIYIFDDSFSALDFKTDARLRTALRKETGQATVIIVAQRVSTVMDADRIVVLDEGAVVGIGKHRELLDSCKVYREIVASQLSEEEMAR